MFLENLLVNPDDNSPLILNFSTNVVENIDNQKYTNYLEGSIPVILPRNLDGHKHKTDLHNQAGSDFNYVEHYQQDAVLFDYCAEYDDSVTTVETVRLRQRIMRCIPNTAKLLLDVGCGSGWLAVATVNDSTKVISMDISTVNPIKALQAVKHENHAGLVADVFHLPIAPNSIDCIIASEIIEHVHNPRLFIEKLVAALKPGGKLILSTPYNEKITHYLCVHCNRPTPANAHLHSFNEKSIGNMIPPEICAHKTILFSNKVLTKLRIALLLGFLPPFLWNPIDTLANKVFRKPARLILVMEKRKTT
jgi:2-polyprenyl-3-methyl-5-hydroxy-6-metoxy-1,4-benzoquinol methylase